MVLYPNKLPESERVCSGICSLEAGRFKLPEYDPQSNSYPMEWRDLVMMVEGIQENPQQRLRRLRAERKEYHV